MSANDGVRITQLPAITQPLDGTEVFPVVQGGATSKATTDQLKDYVFTSDLSDNTVTANGVTRTLTEWMEYWASGGFTADSGGTTLSTDDSGKVYSNEGAVAIAPFILPDAVSGLRYSFIVQNVNGVRVTASGDDTIRVVTQVSAAAGKIESVMVGSTITLVAVNTTEWVALSALGSWAVT